jgi:hypothetical protein
VAALLRTAIALRAEAEELDVEVFCQRREDIDLALTG